MIFLQKIYIPLLYSLFSLDILSPLSLCNSLYFTIWVSVTDSLSHTKSQPTQSRICVHNHHRRLSNTQKVSNSPFIDSSTSIRCSIKANNHIFPTISTPPKPNMRHGPGRRRAKSTEANWVQQEAGGLVHRHSPVMGYKIPFPFFLLLWNFFLEKIVFVEFVISLLDVNFLLIMMWNVTCLCKKLHIKIWVFVLLD